MSRRVVNTGAFYTYIARALGKPAGIGRAYVAVVAYAGLTCGLVGAFGYFTRLVLLELGVDIPWYVYSAVAVVIIGALGYRSADLSAKVLGTLMIAEFAVLIIFDLLVVGEHGRQAFPVVSFSGARGVLRVDRDRVDVRLHQLRRLRIRRALRRGDQGSGAEHSAGHLYRGHLHRRLLHPHHLDHHRRRRRDRRHRNWPANSWAISSST